MTVARIKQFVFYASYIIVCLAIILLQSTGLMTLQIGTASALLILPATVFAGFYFKGFVGAIFGLAFGACLDMYSSTLCFNTIALLLCGFISGLLVSRYFNSNLAAAVVLNISASCLYFFIKWIVIYAFIDPNPIYILLYYTLPSVVYTAVCGVIMYFVINPILKRMPIVRRH